MENVVLGLLMVQSLTLYELNAAFKQGISLFYSASYGSLQTALKGLLAKGLVVFEEKVEKGRNKKAYSITGPGRQAFFAWMLDEIPPSKLEVTALAKIFFLGLVEDGGQRKLIVREILDKVRQAQEELDTLKEELSRIEVPDSFREILKYQLKTLDYGLRSHVFAGGWFAELLQEMD